LAAGSRGRVALFAVGIVWGGLLLLGTPAFASGLCLGDAVVPSPATTSRAALMLACDINVIRTRNGLANLRLDGRLWTVARDQAVDMARSGNLSHVDSSGRDLAARVAISGYLPPDGDGTMVLENIGWGDGGLATPASIAQAWMASDEHRARVLDPTVTDVAVGAAAGSDGVYYAADFGATDSRSAAEPMRGARRRPRKRRRAAHLRRRHHHAHARR
jgi:hypothetical protein